MDSFTLVNCRKELNFYYDRVCGRTNFTQSQRQFIRDIFYLTLPEFSKTDFAQFKNRFATSITNCIKQEYFRIISDPKYKGFSKVGFKARKICKKQPTVEDRDKIHSLLVDYYNDVCIPVISERDDYVSISDYKLKKIKKKSLDNINVNQIVN